MHEVGFKERAESWFKLQPCFSNFHFEIEKCRLILIPIASRNF